MASFRLFQGVCDSFANNVFPNGRGKSYLACGTNGLLTVFVDLTTPDATKLVTLSTENVRGICIFFESPSQTSDPPSRIFVNHDGTLGELNLSTGVITDTDVTGLETSADQCQIYSDGISIFARRASDNAIIEIRDGVVIRSFRKGVDPIFMYAGGTVRGLFAIGEVEIFTTDFDAGAIVNADDFTFEDDRGAIVDVEDDEESIFIDGEEGAIVAIFDAEDQGAIWYARRPIKDRIEIRETRALTEYALHRALAKEFDQKNLIKSTYHFNKFLMIVNREKRRQMKGYINDRSPVVTHFF